MRRFVVVAHKAATTPPPSLDDLAGRAGRWDLLARCVNAALLVSHGMRRDVELFLVLRGGLDAPKTLRLAGSELTSVNPDERSIAALLFKALNVPLPASGNELRSTPGVHVSRRDLGAVLDALAAQGPLVHLAEDGERGDPLVDATFVLSDHEDLSAEERALVMRHAATRLSLGPAAMHADHCIAVVHNRLDVRETAGN